MGTDRPPLVLFPEAWKYKDKKVIKTVRVTRDERTGQIINQQTRLFARVDVWTPNGVAPLQVATPPMTKKRVIFKEINAWGDGNKVQEYHDTTAQSVLPNNIKVNEVDDDTLVYAMYKAGLKLNVAEDAMYGIISQFEDPGTTDMDDDGNQSPDPDDPTTPAPDVTPNSPMPIAMDEPERELEECKTGKFTVKETK